MVQCSAEPCHIDESGRIHDNHATAFKAGSERASQSHHSSHLEHIIMKASGLYGSSQTQYLHCKEATSCQTFIHHTGAFTRQCI